MAIQKFVMKWLKYELVSKGRWTISRLLYSTRVSGCPVTVPERACKQAVISAVRNPR